tara:strand:+ start:272 stop:463 length:192 start_codon:yes stop_codon:yes gene_type:complete
MYDIDLQFDVKIPMRDGIGLSADIYRPRAAGRFPKILLRTAMQTVYPDTDHASHIVLPIIPKG